jgi:hypothetical protein
MIHQAVRLVILHTKNNLSKLARINQKLNFSITLSIFSVSIKIQSLC